MRITIRKATAADARFIAENVLRALHIEETDEQHIEHLAGISSREDTLYSWRNATIALCDGVPAGLMVAYDGARYRQMREVTTITKRTMKPAPASITWTLLPCCRSTVAGEWHRP